MPIYTYASFAFKKDDGATSREKCKKLCLIRYHGTTTLQIHRDNLHIICRIFRNGNVEKYKIKII